LKLEAKDIENRPLRGLAELLEGTEAFSAWEYAVRDEGPGHEGEILGTVCLLRLGHMWFRGIAIVGTRTCPELEVRRRDARAAGEEGHMGCGNDCICGGTGTVREEPRRRTGSEVSQGRALRALRKRLSGEGLWNCSRANVVRFHNAWTTLYGGGCWPDKVAADVEPTVFETRCVIKDPPAWPRGWGYPGLSCELAGGLMGTFARNRIEEGGTC
jgi:hypothetical protein